MLWNDIVNISNCTQHFLNIYVLVNNQAQVVNTGGLKYLIKLMTEDQDEELTSATKYVLRSCMKTGGMMWNIMMNVYVAEKKLY